MALKGVGGRKENSLQEPELAAQPNETRSGERQDGFGSRTMTELGLCWAPSGGFKAVWAGPGSAMLAKVLFSLLLWLRFAAGQDTPEPAPQPSTSNTEGDLLFLLDSSASVSRHEFSKVKEFMWDLLQPFTFGPRDVQTSIIHISTTPSMEFPFDQHLTSSALQKAIGATRQLMGDTNTGQALSYAREKLFSSQAGARPDVPKVLVWVTDGFSTDDISEPMQLLKDRGVTVFIVSTGRGNFLQLSAAASPPSDRHLHFVDVDDLPIITPELRDAIRDVIQANRLHATDVTSSSFRLVWPQLLSQESGFYSLEYGPGANPAARRSLQVPGAQSSLVLSQLAPGTTYEVTLVPESNERYFPPQSTRVTTLPGKGTGLGAPGSPPCQVPGSPPCQVPGSPPCQVKGQGWGTRVTTLPGKGTGLGAPGSPPCQVKGQGWGTRVTTLPGTRVTTLPEEISPAQVLISDSGPRSFQVSWAPVLDSVATYQVLYGPLPGNSAQVLQVDGRHNSTLVEHLAPNTTYLVTVTAIYRSGKEKSLSAKACTLEEGSRVRHLRFEDAGPSSVRATGTGSRTDCSELLPSRANLSDGQRFGPKGGARGGKQLIPQAVPALEVPSPNLAPAKPSQV
ncbi:von Willebrand factor A domain-containing protein 1 isoform X3 [Serinus canaria]|uniref:von Willebrand factor A domain-containing protein 1 isoform X3 n=1 Tax=Serinus canaria TaxID=9135 RepID=UPI0021CC9EC4|nr:von Willebrand factor A domain-containing protein 1 isoform X3 [Serinus canaria]